MKTYFSRLPDFPGLVTTVAISNVHLLEAPDVPLSIECDQCLAFLQLLVAPGALVRIDIFAILLLPDRFLVMLESGSLSRTGGNFFDRLLFLLLFDLSLWRRCHRVRRLCRGCYRTFDTAFA